MRQPIVIIEISIGIDKGPFHQNRKIPPVQAFTFSRVKKSFNSIPLSIDFQDEL